MFNFADKADWYNAKLKQTIDYICDEINTILDDDYLEPIEKEVLSQCLWDCYKSIKNLTYKGVDAKV